MMSVQLRRCFHDAPATTKFFDLDKPSLEHLLSTSLNWPAFRAQQLWEGFYFNGARDLPAVRGLSAEHRNALSPVLNFDPPAVLDHEAASADGTVKFLVKYAASASVPNARVEVVFIPDGDRGTLCVSSQAGCSLACTFCHTGTQKLQRNLSPGEIVGQVLVARRRLQELGTPAINRLVFMGQGEPGYNPRSVLTALRILTHGSSAKSSPDDSVKRVARKAALFAPHRITVSTAGVAPFISKLGREPAAYRLAVSLHAPSDVLRTSIMPINTTYPLASVMDACAEYLSCRIAVLEGRVQEGERVETLSLGALTRWFELHNDHHNSGRRVRISFEYVLLSGVNDGLRHARELAGLLLKHLPAEACHVNLLNFNAWPGVVYRQSPSDQAAEFQRELRATGILATLRRSRGSDVLGACGQLKSSMEPKLASRPARAASDASDQIPAAAALL